MVSKKSSLKKKVSSKKTRRKKISHPKLNIHSEREIAMDFATKVHKKFDLLVKATVMFGSQTKKTSKSGSDIDIIIIIDDASVEWDMELIAWYREELGKIIATSPHSVDLHVNTIKLTTWWNDLMHGDPLVINVLRSGEALIDVAGFFKPLKVLLFKGYIHSTTEAVYNALQRAPMHLARSKGAELGTIEGVYWSMVDSAQAALMTLGLLPPSPEHITSMLKQNFADQKIMDVEYVKWYRDIHQLHKGIAHGEIIDLKGADIDLWQERARNFLKKMTDIIDKKISSGTSKI